MVAEEVRRQLAMENQEASLPQGSYPDPARSGVVKMLSDSKVHVFVVGAALDVNSTNGECFVTEGDVLQLMAEFIRKAPPALA